MTEETRDGPTPNGGVRSTIYYQDDDGRPAEKEAASQWLGVEYDAGGEPVHRTYGRLRPLNTEGDPATILAAILQARAEGDEAAAAALEARLDAPAP